MLTSGPITEMVERTARAYRNDRLWKGLDRRFEHFGRQLSYALGDRAPNVSLHCPGYVDPASDPQERRLVERIFAAYKCMKRDEAKAAAVYRPASVWDEQLRRAYQPFLLALERDDISGFHFFLANFGTWKQYHGLESTTLLWDNMRTVLGRRYLKHAVFLTQVEQCLRLTGGRTPASSLSYPLHGNQSGAYVEGVFVGAFSCASELYGSQIAGILSDRHRPVVAELGAGYGRLAYFLLRDLPRFAYVDFDLPEPLCVAAYYLMKTWPEKRALLYGEANDGGVPDLTNDLVFLPSFTIDQVPAEPIVDLFLNTYSLGEMPATAASHFVRQAATWSHYIFHVNHDQWPVPFDDGSVGLLGWQYPIPPEQWKLLFRESDRSALLGFQEFESDIFCYLYGRRGAAAPRTCSSISSGFAAT